TNRKLLLAVPAGLSMLLASSVAQAQEPPPSEEAFPMPPESTVDAPKPAEVPKPPEAPKAAEAPQPPSRFKIEFYGALLPFAEHVNVSGATPAGFTGGASQVEDSLYTGINAPARFRATSGT